jgi:hypothetical protein
VLWDRIAVAHNAEVVFHRQQIQLGLTILTLHAAEVLYPCIGFSTGKYLNEVHASLAFVTRPVALGLVKIPSLD